MKYRNTLVVEIDWGSVKVMQFYFEVLEIHQCGVREEGLLGTIGSLTKDKDT